MTDLFELLHYSNELKKANKFFKKENPEAFKILLNYMLIIEENYHLSEKQEYINIINDFLSGIITAEDFSNFFMGVYEGINAEVQDLKNKESLALAKFLKNTYRCEVGILLASIYGDCDTFLYDSNYSITSEKELKDYAKTLLLKLQDE